MNTALVPNKSVSWSDDDNIEIIPPASLSDKEQADKVRGEVESLLDVIAGDQSRLETNLALLCGRLAAIQAKQYWIDWGFKSFSSYLVSIESRVKKGRTQLYHCAGIGTDLLPVFTRLGLTEDSLAEIGITKAAVLRTMVKDGKTPTLDLIDSAKTMTKEQLEGEIAETTGLRLEHEKGTWFSLGGVFYDKDERNEFLRAANVAAKTDPVLGHEIKNWPDVSPSTKKEILHRLCAEYLATYEAQVERGEA